MSRDTLPHWLYQRFCPDSQMVPWEKMDLDDKLYWARQAHAVRRAVARDGFKNPEIADQPGTTVVMRGTTIGVTPLDDENPCCCGRPEDESTVHRHPQPCYRPGSSNEGDLLDEPSSRPSFECPKCKRASYHPEDKRYGWCGNCNAYTGSVTGRSAAGYEGTVT